MKKTNTSLAAISKNYLMLNASIHKSISTLKLQDDTQLQSLLLLLFQITYEIQLCLKQALSGSDGTGMPKNPESSGENQAQKFLNEPLPKAKISILPSS